MVIFRKLSIPVLGAAVMAAASACSNEKNHNPAAEADEVLVVAGDSALTMGHVLAQIPAGLAPEDSAAMFHKIVESWVNGIVLEDIAEKNIPDLERIDKMTENYRRELIVNSYMRVMADRYNRNVPETRIKNYYNAHQEEMVLSQPIIKGAYLKVAESDPDLDKLRGWLADLSDATADKIEKSLRQASQYLYFRNTWHDWNVISEQIPYRFFDADAFLRSTRDFETSDAGSVYLLHISEYLPSGSEMPYDYARGIIAERLRTEDMAAYRAGLVNKIYSEKIEQGWLVPGLYDPRKPGMLKTDEKKTTSDTKTK
ncbi:MAG: peptidyl-prolyl cis-trans isomerase [Muribaculaceae bacterium]|nr:peptidyl-prolyl cis-trans isomerase [Muribaculaceae bacterium]